MHRFPLLSLAAAALILSTLSCATGAPLRGQQVTGLDRKLSTFAYIEQGDLVTLIVDTRSTQYREAEAYVPIEICVANNGLKKMTLTRESFTLIDEQGNRYPAAYPRELIESYDFLDFDRRLSELEGIVFNKFAAYTRYPSKFSPTRSFGDGRSAVVRDMISLPKFGYMIDFLYFPKPGPELRGKRFELFIDSPDLSDPVFVKFMVK